MGILPQKRMEFFRLLLEHLAGIEHQLLSGIRDSRKAGSLWKMMRGVGGGKEVRTPELIGQIKNFRYKVRCVSIETINARLDVSVGTVHTIIRKELKTQKICAKFVPRVLREDQKERRRHVSREMVELINSDPAVLDALMTCDESWWAGSKKARQNKSTHKILMIPFFDSTGMIYMHWVPTGQTFNMEFNVEVLREFRKIFLSEEASTLQIGSVAFPRGQCTSPQLHPCHRLFDQDEHQDSSSASLQSRPCSLWLLVIP